MRIIAVDDERHPLNALIYAVEQAAPNADVHGFTDENEAITFARRHKVDIAFLDIQLRTTNGLALAKSLKDIHPTTNIIFVTGYSHYAGNAFEMHASGYLLKPATPEKILHEIENLRHPVLAPTNGIRAQCFGNFEIFVNGAPITFSRAKSKEVLAYLVDRKGASVTKKEISAVVLEKEEYSRGIQSYVHKILTDMVLSLNENGASDIIIKGRNFYAVDTTKFSCDFYNYINGDISAVNSYHGEYMTNYGWAEFTAGMLNDIDK